MVREYTKHYPRIIRTVKTVETELKHGLRSLPLAVWRFFPLALKSNEVTCRGIYSCMFWKLQLLRRSSRHQIVLLTGTHTNTIWVGKSVRPRHIDVVVEWMSNEIFCMCQIKMVVQKTLNAVIVSQYMFSHYSCRGKTNIWTSILKHSATHRMDHSLWCTPLQLFDFTSRHQIIFLTVSRSSVVYLMLTKYFAGRECLVIS